MSNRRKFLGQVGGVTAVAVAGPLVAWAGAPEKKTSGEKIAEMIMAAPLLSEAAWPLSGAERIILPALRPEMCAPRTRQFFRVWVEFGPKDQHLRNYGDVCWAHVATHEYPHSLHRLFFLPGTEPERDMLGCEETLRLIVKRPDSLGGGKDGVAAALAMLVLLAEHNTKACLPFHEFWSMRDDPEAAACR